MEPTVPVGDRVLPPEEEASINLQLQQLGGEI